MSGSQNWKEEALCKDLPIEEVDRLFFIGRGQSAKRARLFCAQCPVQKDCLNYSLAYGEAGTWGGQTEEERDSLDPFIVNLIQQREYELHGKEDRDLNHFIPRAKPVTHQHLNSLEELTLAVESLLEELAEPTVVQLEALDHLSLDPTDLRESG